MQDDVGLQHLFKRCAECRDQVRRQVGDEAHRVGDDGLATMGQPDPPHGRIEGGEQKVACIHSGRRQGVEQRRFSCIGVAHERHNGERHALPAPPVQLARALDLVELLFDTGQPLLDEPPVGLDLGLAGAADEAEAAALALKMGPGAHQPALLIAEMGMLHLQRAFPGARPATEDLQNQAGAIQHLGFPGPLQVALLAGRQLGIDHHQLGLALGNESRDLGDLSAPHEKGRYRGPQPHDDVAHDLDVNRPGKPHGFTQSRLGRTVGVLLAACTSIDMNDQCARQTAAGAIICRLATAALHSLQLSFPASHRPRTD